jgi:4-amino-4-deoxy-L-arabinose transferase-like glycosyltransferase
MNRPGFIISLLLAILMLGLVLRLAPWGQNRFLEDEALYAYWGLQIATGTDPMLDYEPVDKPPLHPYTLALSFLLSSPRSADEVVVGREAPARLPSLLASMLSILLVYALGREIYGDERIGLLAAFLLAVSPFDILFASTAFTDPLMTAWVLSALLAAAKGRLGAAGLLAGLAAATKQQGLLFLPLVALFGLLSMPGGRRGAWLCFLLGFAAIAGMVTWWDMARMQRPGFFVQGLLSYGRLEPAQPESLGPRALEWLRLAGFFWRSPWFNAILVGGLAGWLYAQFAGRPFKWGIGRSRIDITLAAFVAAFLLLHWLIGFQVWDRYLLGIVPLVALMAARAFVALGQAIRSSRWRRVYAGGLALAVLASLTGPAVQAAHSEIPVGGDHGAYDGIDALASYMRSEAPPGAVLYHFWLGYHYRFYLYGAPLRLHWYPDLEDLILDATVYRREPRYIAFPSWRDDAPARSALAKAGIGLVPVFATTRRDGSVSFRLYHLEGP